MIFCPLKINETTIFQIPNRKPSWIKRLSVKIFSCFVSLRWQISHKPYEQQISRDYTLPKYFRRILCNILGVEIANGELPKDMQLLGRLVEDISYNNAKAYFEFNK